MSFDKLSLGQQKLAFRQGMVAGYNADRVKVLVFRVNGDRLMMKEKNIINRIFSR